MWKNCDYWWENSIDILQAEYIISVLLLKIFDLKYEKKSIDKSDINLMKKDAIAQIHAVLTSVWW